MRDPVLAVLACAVLAGPGLRADPAGAGPERPNFIVILADDMGYGDAPGFGGGAFAMPELDRMGREGLRFVDFHANGAVCSPTRAALLTGRYAQRSGIEGILHAGPDANRHHGLQPDAEATFAEMLRDAGYATGLLGKWHLGYEPRYSPLRHGFDVFRGYVSGYVDYWSHLDGAGAFDWWHDEQLDREDEGYVTRLITSHAVRFIEEHKDRPFCLYLAHAAPHRPYQGPEQSGDATRAGRPPRSETKKVYAAMLAELDRGVGAVLDAVKQAGLGTRTLVFFFSDNGATGPGSNGRLRGEKGTLWEGGHRVPAVAWWPGRFAPGTTTELALGMDLMPTMLALAGVEPPADRPLDGTSLLPVLLERRSLGERTVFWQYGKQQAVREGTWKLIRNAPGASGTALFDLASDLEERTDLARLQRERVDRMLEALEAWGRDVRKGATRQPAKLKYREARGRAAGG